MISDWFKINIGDSIWYVGTNLHVYEFVLTNHKGNNCIVTRRTSESSNVPMSVSYTRDSSFLFSNRNEAEIYAFSLLQKTYPNAQLNDIVVHFFNQVAIPEPSSKAEIGITSTLTLESLENSLKKLVSPDLKEALMRELRNEYEKATN